MVAKRLDVRLDPDHRRKLEEVAASRGAPVSRVIRELIDQAHQEVDLTRRKAAVLAYAENVEAAAILVDRYPGMSARDLLHTAVMQRVGSDRIVSADRDFDRVHGLQRLDPADFAAWRASVEA